MRYGAAGSGAVRRFVRASGPITNRGGFDALRAVRLPAFRDPPASRRNSRPRRGRARSGNGRIRRPDPARLAPDGRDGGGDEGLQRQAGNRARRRDRQQDQGGGEQGLVQVGGMVKAAGTPVRLGLLLKGPRVWWRATGAPSREDCAFGEGVPGAFPSAEPATSESGGGGC